MVTVIEEYYRSDKCFNERFGAWLRELSFLFFKERWWIQFPSNACLTFNLHKLENNLFHCIIITFSLFQILWIYLNEKKRERSLVICFCINVLVNIEWLYNSELKFITLYFIFRLSISLWNWSSKLLFSSSTKV